MTNLKDLDEKALVARLALVKERVVEEAAVIGDPYDPTEVMTAKTPAQLAAELAETLAVLDECAARLLRPKAAASPERAAASAGGIAADLERLRGLIRSLVARLDKHQGPRCLVCAASAGHDDRCPFPALVAEAARP